MAGIVRLNTSLRNWLLEEKRRRKKEMDHDRLFEVIRHSVSLDKVILHPRTLEEITIAIGMVHGGTLKILREWGVKGSNTSISASKSADHMYNQMQNIFLEQLELFKRVLIVTTNLVANMNTAFSRRFHYKIEFRRPGPDERLRFWQVHIPEKAPLAKDVDLYYLARHHVPGLEYYLQIEYIIFLN